MEAEVAAARALTFQAATAVDEDDPRLTKLAAMAKMKASDAAMRITTEAVQVLGGNGYLKDFPAERMIATRRCCRSPRAPTRSSGW